jgi:outer membrane immunogenic protein
MILALSAIAPALKAADVSLMPPPPPGPPPMAPPPPVPGPGAIVPPLPYPCFWNGFYVGANLGGAWVGEDFVDASGNTFSLNNSGFIGGGQLGYNYQIGSVVLGAEWMFDGISLNLPAVNGNAIDASANTRWVTTFAARFGWSWDRWLIYGKAGAGFVGTNVSIVNPTTGASVTTSNDNSGLLVGAGAEWLFAPNWTVKLEYDYLALSNLSVSPTTAAAAGVDGGSGRNLQMFTVGVNYLFNWSLVPRY